MMLPTYRNLRSTASWWQASVSICSGAGAPSGNPRFYKYCWRIFSIECSWEGEAFFKNAPVLCAADYEKEVARLLRQGLSCLVYGLKLPRRDPSNPWDMAHPKWATREFAPSWEDDTDPIVEGGHR